MKIFAKYLENVLKERFDTVKEVRFHNDIYQAICDDKKYIIKFNKKSILEILLKIDKNDAVKKMKDLKEIGLPVPKILFVKHTWHGDFIVMNCEAIPLAKKSVYEYDLMRALDALKKFHEKEIVHNQINPENILILQESVYFIDVEKSVAGKDFKGDVADLIAAFATRMDVKLVVDIGLRYYDKDFMIKICFIIYMGIGQNRYFLSKKKAEEFKEVMSILMNKF